ncbi:hypothetical protein [Chryseobacterium cheonjiense]|uniref:Uncharacterized protein n=1 Tax=Chryseobacterium cheonjiense TaxID=2728845 RepID=A0A7Y0FJP5_9FLAO|nr:hypothetical protein [Chryseobacterium cheonjiense]NML58779.1 hypothetical protein [Chryseobacterium cheonjiense]
MIKKVSKTEAIKAKMAREGKVTSLNSPRHISAIASMNKQLETVRREYQTKDRNSQIEANKVILTA